MTVKPLIICATLSSLLCSTGFAGIYVGAGVGSDYVDLYQKSHVVGTVAGHPEEGFNVYNNVHLSGTGVFGTLFAGYQKLNNKLYLAGEINGNLSSNSAKSSNTELLHSSFSAVNYKMSNVIGVSVLPGYQYTDTSLYYGRLGYASGHFKSSSTDISIANVSERKNGFRWGLGTKQAINDRFSFRLEYSQTFYNKVKFGTFDPVGAVIKDTTIAPFQQLVEFGVVYTV